MRDASVLSSQPDKSNFREKMQSWTVCEDSVSPYVQPRPTTSLADQKPSNYSMADIDREMSFLMSRPSTTAFPTKPKELIEPLDGIMPDERPVSQKKFLVLPSIGHRHASDLLLRRQRSNLETVNQLDYSRNQLEEDVHFFSDYYNINTTNKNSNHNNLQHNQNSHHNHQFQQYNQHQRQKQQQQKGKSNNAKNDHNEFSTQSFEFRKRHFQQHNPNSGHGNNHNPNSRPNTSNSASTHHPHYYSDSDDADSVVYAEIIRDPRQSPTKTGKSGTPMPLPPIHKIKWDKFNYNGLTELEEETAYALYSCDGSRVSPDTGSELDDEDDLEEFRLKTPETLDIYRTDSPTTKAFTPPPGFRWRHDNDDHDQNMSLWQSPEICINA